MPNLADIFPDVETVLAIEPEELGAVLIELWEGAANRHDDTCLVETFASELFTPGQLRYPANKQQALYRCIAEAMSWLEREGLIIHEPGQPAPWYRRTRRGLKFKTRADFAAFRQANILPRSLLHPAIEEKTWPLFLRGDYDAAVLLAFKSVEVAVRDAGQYRDDLIGVALMREAFDAKDGPLTDKTVVPAEREALAHLFAGAIGHAKNPQSHRDHPIEIKEAAQLLLFASYLLDIVEARAKPTSAGP